MCPTNQDPANLLGGTNFHSDNVHALNSSLRALCVRVLESERASAEGDGQVTNEVRAESESGVYVSSIRRRDHNRDLRW